jgi:hypothetical protein
MCTEFLLQAYISGSYRTTSAVHITGSPGFQASSGSIDKGHDMIKDNCYINSEYTDNTG